MKYKSEKGFALIGILVVIVILVIAIVIVRPSILNNILGSEENTWEKQKEIIIDAAKKYSVENISTDLAVGESKKITIKDLKECKLIDGEIKNPLTNEVIPDETEVIIITKNGENSYSYKFIESEGDSTVPGVPTIVSISKGTYPYEAIITWDAPKDDGGSAIIGYRIEKKGISNWNILIDNTNNTNTSYVDTHYTCFSDEYYRVLAINSVGIGSASVEMGYALTSCE